MLQGSETPVSCLARHIEAFNFADVSHGTRERARLWVFDTLACARAGWAFRDSFQFFGAPPASPECADSEKAHVWFSELRAPVEHAARVNACFVHHTEMDDGNPRGSVHGGSVIIPTAIAFGESLNISLQSWWSAVVAAYNAGTAIARLIKPGIQARNLHPPGIVGPLCAAGAASRLWVDANAHLSKRQRLAHIRHALGIAAGLTPLATFEGFTRGALVKELYAGHAAFLGIQAARASFLGATAPESLFGALDDALGSFFQIPHAADKISIDDEELTFVEFKAFASVRATHASLSALESLLPLPADAIARIEIETYPFAVQLSDASDARTAIGAKANLPYCAASLVLDGTLDPGAFTREKLDSPERAALMSKVRVSTTAEALPKKGARLRVHLRNGGTSEAATNTSRWSLERPASEKDIHDKAQRIAGEWATTLKLAMTESEATDALRPLTEALATP